MPVAVHVLDGESGVEQGIGQGCQVAKAQLAARNHDLTGGAEDVVALEADATITLADEFQPALHRSVGRVELLVGGLTVPALPGPVSRVAALEGQVAAGA